MRWDYLGPADVLIEGRAKPHELIGLVLALEERAAQPERDRRRLDREIGARAVEAGERDGLAILRRWLAEAPAPATRERIGRVRSSLALLRSVMLGVGLFLGWAAAAALLQVEVDAGRINIVLCVGLLVGLPLAMLVTSVGALAWANQSNVGENASRGSWQSAGLGRGAMAILPHSVRSDIEILVGRFNAHERLYARTRRVQLFVWSQAIGFGFAVGATLATISLVVFTDLAFGWSTTLDVEASKVHALAKALATPWSAIWVEAVPSFDLVETTRHFRAGPEPIHGHVVDAIRYGGWWPFLVMAIVCYSLVPRVLALGLGARRLGEESGRAIAHTPGVERLLERLTTPLVETKAPEAEGTIGHAGEGALPLEDVHGWWARQAHESAMAIAWAESIEDAELLRAFAAGDMKVRDAGGRRTLAEDAECITEAGASAGAVMVCVRAFEPPMLEVLDFLVDLRASIGDSRSLGVLLLEGDEGDRATWARKLATLGDPCLGVLAGMVDRGAGQAGG